MDNLTAFDLHSIGIVYPDIVILEIGSNNLCYREVKPETVGSKIEALVHHLHAHFRLKFIVVCQTINRTVCPRGTTGYNDRVVLLNQYLGVVLDAIPYAKFGPTKSFASQMFPFCVRMASTSITKGNMPSIGGTGGAILCARKGILVQSPNDEAHPFTLPA